MSKTCNPWAALALLLLLISRASPARDDTLILSLESYSTFHSIGLELSIDGDANHNAVASLQYRASGSSPWKNGPDLFRVDYTPASPAPGLEAPFNGFAGSILFLAPGQDYELQLTITDPDGGNDNRTLATSTRAQPQKPVGGRTWHVIPGNGGGDGSEGNPYQGIQEAQNHARAGDIFLLHTGIYSGFDSGGEIQLNMGGSPGNYIVWQAAPASDVIFDSPLRIAADHLWVESIHVRGHVDVANEYGLRTYNAPRDVVIRGNLFTDFYYSIALNHGGNDWLITDNTIIGDKDLYMEDGPASWGGEGIELQATTGHTVSWNRISLVADGISSGLRNVDIFRNDIFNTTDDGIEPDYAYANIRVWENRISNVRHNGFSFQPMNQGPWYFIRNQVAAPLESTLKIRQTSRVLLAHNIFVGWDDALGHAWPSDVQGILSFHSLNNIWISANNSYVWDHNAGGQAPDWRTRLDHDAFDQGASSYTVRWNGVQYTTLNSFSLATGLEPNAIQFDRDVCLQSFDIPQAPPSPMSLQYFSLKTGCNAIDAGVLLPGINEDFNGTAPDLGPYETGKALPRYGPRMELWIFADGFEYP
jgi:hypothetical protein